MTNEQAKSELMQIYMSLSEEKKQALDVLMAQNCDQCEVGNACLYCEHEFKAKADRNEFYNWDAPIRHKADGEKTCGTCRNEDTYHCAECENKSDYEQAQADGECDFTCKYYASGVCLREDDHDGCKDCKYETYPEYYYPCCECKHNYMDMWKREKSTDTITMTREEFSEKLMEHYRQGRADEKAYQNGEIMQSFNPD